jgi:hypothetical protein
MRADLVHAHWIKSSHSNGGGGGCLEWAPSYAPARLVPVRDSKHPERTALLFTPAAWRAFVAAARTGEL